MVTLIPYAFGVPQCSEIAKRGRERQNHVVFISLITFFYLVVAGQFLVVIDHRFFGLLKVQNIAARVLVYYVHTG